ncbi:DUF1385 domain-containing protein [Lachnospiraceae bacterium 38-14]|uniref:DUF1385 domain-containing protein n=1 Tax=Roseburia sp. 1XD42-69 TaxID=2320088 RepID=UPI000EA17894|nr:DUF1385 domain-containing protein [Roseburia sp. 1XD42-69]RKJ65323.1 DUF1385 domain-containing protein [Roseburia sp. 1XD42-69]
MKYSKIGGQAVMEGIMMKNGNQYAVAVRKPDSDIEVEIFQYEGIVKNEKIRNLPLLRGVFSFIESLVIGMGALTFSASFFEEEEQDKGKEKDGEKEKKKEDFAMTLTVAFSVLLAVGIFILLPYGISLVFQKYISSHMIISLLEGILRLLIFVGYVAGISLMPDIKRVYMYHGAEHKCINCVEHGMELTLENVRKSSKQHKRCGTSFLLLVMLISILLFMFIYVKSRWLRLFLRLALIPVIAGISYEFIRLAGRKDNGFVNLLSKPGLMLQKITTREPEDSMIEVGIASVEAVFDWRNFLKENF